MTVVSPNRRHWPSPSDPAYRSEEYEQMKAEETEDLLARMEQLLPGLRDAIRVMEIGTPSTVERYTLRNWGNLGGPKPSMGSHMMQRPHARSDWGRLYLCGDSTVMGEGVVATTSSGIGAANMVLRDLEMEEYVAHHFDRQYVNYTGGKPWTPPPEDSAPLDAAAARRLAHECQLCEDAPCITACPTSIDIPGFLRRIETGNLAGAAAVVREANPLSEVCGLVCPAEKLCEAVCTRNTYEDAPVRIRDLHGWVCREVPGTEGWGDAATRSGRRVAVVGAGPAGLTAAHFLARAGHEVDVFESSDRPGGILTQAIPGFRLDDATVEREIAEMTTRGVNWHLGTTVGRDVSLDQLEADFDALFVAPGLGEARFLDLAGGSAPVSVEALDVLRDARSGEVSTGGEHVVVIGGGSVASDAALTAATSGAASVALVCLEAEHEMPVLASELVELRSAGVELHTGWGPAELVDQGVRFLRCHSVFDAEGCFAPQLDPGDEMVRCADRVVAAVGQRPGAGLAADLAGAALAGTDGRDGTCQLPGRPIHLGGDLGRGGGTVVEAVADGRRAAAAIDAALNSVPA
jgi:NADPH-dependent glutamate synthase beta subunit-like oxidoreductase